MEIGALVREFFITAGPGGVVVISVILAACVIYFFLTRWILGVKKESSPEIHPQPGSERL